MNGKLPASEALDRIANSYGRIESGEGPGVGRFVVKGTIMKDGERLGEYSNIHTVVKTENVLRDVEDYASIYVAKNYGGADLEITSIEELTSNAILLNSLARPSGCAEGDSLENEAKERDCFLSDEGRIEAQGGKLGKLQASKPSEEIYRYKVTGKLKNELVGWIDFEVEGSIIVNKKMSGKEIRAKARMDALKAATDINAREKVKNVKCVSYYPRRDAWKHGTAAKSLRELALKGKPGMRWGDEES